MAGHLIGTATDTSGSFTEAHKNFIEQIHASTTASGEAWTEMRYDTSTTNHELILKGAGITSGEEIYVGFYSYQDPGADYYNIGLGTFTGYLSGEAFTNQPGAVTTGVPAHNTNLDYWLTWNGRRIAFSLNVETVYESGYVGKIIPYALSTQLPYPVVCAGMLDGMPATRYSDESYHMPYLGNRANMKFRDNSGTWIQPKCYPYSNDQNVLAGSTNCLRDTSGEYPLMPVELFDSNNLYGALDGIYFISGFNITVEDTATIDSGEYIVMRNVYRTDFNDYYVIGMD